jgi:hypothetical protein
MKQESAENVAKSQKSKTYAFEYARLSLDYYRMNGRTPDTVAALKRAVEKCEAVRED